MTPATRGAIKENEYVYRWSIPEASYEPEKWVAHRIIKRSRYYCFVARWEWSRQTIKLPRLELEQKGSVWHRVSRERYYSEEGKAKFDQEHVVVYSVPECLKTFGLDWTATADDVKRAYRRIALRCHPDKGGSNDAFRQLQAHYDAAMGIVSA